MGVVDGSPVSAAVTNPAFLDADSDDTALGKLTLNNISDPANSGPQVSNIQREFNAISSFTGKPTNVAYTYTPVWTNNQVGTGSDSLFVRTNSLTGTFDGTTGHDHSGVDGQGPQLSGASITNIPLLGFFNQGIQLTGVTGSTWDVSTELTGKTPSSGSASLGVVVTAPYNKAVLRNTAGDEFVNGSGDVIYGRVTESAGVWTLSFYYLNAGTETAYSFVGATTIDWYYQELYAPNISTPVYSQLAVTPSDNTTADVITATTSAQGKTQLSAVAPGVIASSGSAGTANATVANADHTHEGVHSVQVDGDVTVGLGDVILKAGTGVTLAWVSGKIEITASGAASTANVEYRTLTGGEITAKQLTLAYTPTVPGQTILDVISGGPQNYSTDFIVSGNVLDWNGLGLDGILTAGDVLRILYWH